MQRGDHAAAETAFRRARTLGDVRSDFGIGLTCEARGQLSRAERHHRLASLAGVKDADAALARLARLRGRHATAE